jgi:hypothetical protein
MSEEVIQSVCAGLLGGALYLRVLWMFGEAAFRGVFSYRLGEIRGKPARAIGVVGLLGMVSFAYLGVGVYLDRQPPLWPLAGFFLALAVLMVLAVSIFGLVRIAWQRK